MEKGNRTIQILKPKCEYAVNPLGIDVQKPRFSWMVQALERGAGQSGWQIRVTEEGKNEVWDSGKIESDDSVNIQYGGEPLKSGTIYRWELTVWDLCGQACRAVDSFFETAILHEEEWKAAWIRGKNLFRKQAADGRSQLWNRKRRNKNPVSTWPVWDIMNYT